MKRTLAKQTRDADTMQATQNVPNTRLSLIIAKQLQYEHYWLSLQLLQSRTTCLTSLKHSYTNLSHQDSSVVTTFATPTVHLKHVSTIDSLSLLYGKTSHRLTILSHNTPHLDLGQDFPNSKVTLPTTILNPKKVTPTLST
jgi:hypothetical protein